MTLKPQLMECLCPSVWGSITGQLWNCATLFHLFYSLSNSFLGGDIGGAFLPYEMVIPWLCNDHHCACLQGWTLWIIRVLIVLLSTRLFNLSLSQILDVADRANSPGVGFGFLWGWVPCMHRLRISSFPTARVYSLDKLQLLYMGKRQDSSVA